MKTPCHKCSCTGFLVDFGGYDSDGKVKAIKKECPKCKGTGWVEEEK